MCRARLRVGHVGVIGAEALGFVDASELTASTENQGNRQNLPSHAADGARASRTALPDRAIGAAPTNRTEGLAFA